MFVNSFDFDCSHCWIRCKPNIVVPISSPHYFRFWLSFSRSADRSWQTIFANIVNEPYMRRRMFGKNWKCANNNWNISVNCLINIKHSSNILSIATFESNENQIYHMFTKHANKYDSTIETVIPKHGSTFHWSQRSCFDCSIASKSMHGKTHLNITKRKNAAHPSI